MALERKRRESLDAQQLVQRAAALEHRATTLATRFVTRLLDRLTSPELGARLADLALEDLPAQPPDQLRTLLGALREPEARVRVVSAHALDTAHRAAFSNALDRLAGRPLEVLYCEDPALKAGISIMAGSWVLMANLRDELGFFAGSFDHGA